jgi:hypothetical protein
MSFDASGSVAGAIVFSKWRGRNYVRRHAIPANPRTGPQLAARSIMAFLGGRWASIGVVPQASWEAGAEATKISAFNQYCKINARDWKDLFAPSWEYPAARSTAAGVPGVLVATVFGRQVEVVVPVAPGAADWGVALLRRDTTGVDTFANAVVVAQAAGAVNTFVDGPLSPGTYFFNAIVFSVDGLASAIGTEASAVIT